MEAFNHLHKVRHIVLFQHFFNCDTEMHDKVWQFALSQMALASMKRNMQPAVKEMGDTQVGVRLSCVHKSSMLIKASLSIQHTL